MSSSSGAELATKLLRAANTLPRALDRGVFEAGLAAKTTAVAAYVAAGVATSGSRLGNWSVGFDVKGTINPTALVQVRGRKMHLFDNPTKAHRIEPRRRTRRSSDSRSRKALTMPAAGPGEVRGYANHPGTKGKRVFHGKAKPQIIAQTPAILARGIRSGLISAGLGR